MPEIFPTRIISFSSEDRVFPASNLLKTSSFSKWKSEKGGNRQEAVEFDFGEPVEFSRLDIGNNGSAFIEVLVRRSASTDEPTVLLPSSSFMSPLEAKNETNFNRVRVFSKDNLSKSAVTQKWDVVKFVCSQPFNKIAQYGLSFISFHSPPVRGSTVVTVPYTEKRVETKLLPDVSASMLEDDDLISSPDLQPGSLFLAAKRMASVEEKTETCSTTSVAQKIRAANSSSSVPKASITTSSPTPSTCSPSGNSLPGHAIPSQQNHPASCSRNTSTTTKPRNTTSSGVSKHTSTPSPDIPSTASTSGRKQKGDSDNAPLKGVIFSLSGYQNPLRSELRDKALSLGASFRQNWTSDCTHLICAFQNTPKFNQVKGHGIIVSDKWIIRCYDTTSLVDWRPYRVGRAPTPTDLRSADNQRAARASTSRTRNNENPTSPLSEKSPSPSSRTHKRRRTATGRHDDDGDWKPDLNEDDEAEEDEEEEEEEIDSDQASEDNRPTRRSVKPKPSLRDTPSDDDYLGDSGNQDTDDEIERAISGTRNKQTPVDATTEDEDVVLEELPDIFEGKHFFIHNRAIPADEERLLRRLILAFAGNLHTYMHPEVQFVVSRSSWSDEFNEALKTNANLVFVLPDWVIACDQEAAWLTYDNFIINP